MQADIEHFRTKLGKINGGVEVGDRLLKLVQAKTTAAPAPAPAPAPASSPEPEPRSENQSPGNRSESGDS
jgi:vacuolar protein sorting-associated protein 54